MALDLLDLDFVSLYLSALFESGLGLLDQCLAVIALQMFATTDTDANGASLLHTHRLADGHHLPAAILLNSCGSHVRMVKLNLDLDYFSVPHETVTRTLSVQSVFKLIEINFIPVEQH